ncbi:hypothetical protein [Actinomadura madurae]|uniref:hypothetical protein n=1 Tax=Actinomadura madurae TaxID=1993 RepID=UPI0020D220DD|nr:hypothetical protein [Actinomadura madurae]MCP9950171.1 hypothetical protein [Actinomadura madurae]MCQ0009063.1 hypothetical protein [Actinomadura madurae]
MLSSPLMTCPGPAVYALRVAPGTLTPGTLTPGTDTPGTLTGGMHSPLSLQARGR